MFGLFGGKRAPGMSAAEAVRLSAEGALTVIDVRGADEIARGGKAAGALHIPLMMLGMRADPRSPECVAGLDCDKPVALYCASGARSGMAADMLRKFGYTQVHNIGSFGDWLSAGGAREG